MASWFFKEKRNSIFVLKILYKSWLNSETENNRDLQPLFLTGTKGDAPEPLLEPPASQHQRDTAEALVPPFVPFFPWPLPARPIWIKTWTQPTQCCGSLLHTPGPLSLLSQQHWNTRMTLQQKSIDSALFALKAVQFILALTQLRCTLLKLRASFLKLTCCC